MPSLPGSSYHPRCESPKTVFVARMHDFSYFSIAFPSLKICGIAARAIQTLLEKAIIEKEKSKAMQGYYTLNPVHTKDQVCSWLGGLEL